MAGMLRMPDSCPGWTPASWQAAPWLFVAVLAMADRSLWTSTACAWRWCTWWAMA